MDDIVGRLQSLLPQHQFDVIIGSLLGDARLECRSTGVRYPVSARLRIQQGEKQKEYVFWKYQQLQDFVLRGPRRIKAGYDKKRDRTDYSWYFHTRTIEAFGALYHYFYRGKVKIFPKHTFEFLSPRALAVWFMDDGSNNREAYTINTHSFSKEEQFVIADGLKERYGILATVVKDRTKWKIALGRREYPKLNAVIEPFIVPSMIYKICNPRNDFASRVLRSRIERESLYETSVLAHAESE